MTTTTTAKPSKAYVAVKADYYEDGTLLPQIIDIHQAAAMNIYEIQSAYIHPLPYLYIWHS